MAKQSNKTESTPEATTATLSDAQPQTPPAPKAPKERAVPGVFCVIYHDGSFEYFVGIRSNVEQWVRFIKPDFDSAVANDGAKGKIEQLETIQVTAEMIRELETQRRIANEAKERLAKLRAKAN